MEEEEEGEKEGAREVVVGGRDGGRAEREREKHMLVEIREDLGQ